MHILSIYNIDVLENIMHKINTTTLDLMSKLPNHSQKILSDIIEYLLNDKLISEDITISKCERFIVIVVNNYETVMPEIEMLHSRIFENQWEDDNPHFVEHIHEIIDDMITDYN